MVTRVRARGWRNRSGDPWIDPVCDLRCDPAGDSGKKTARVDTHVGNVSVDPVCVSVDHVGPCEPRGDQALGLDLLFLVSGTKKDSPVTLAIRLRRIKRGGRVMENNANASCFGLPESPRFLRSGDSAVTIRKLDESHGVSTEASLILELAHLIAQHPGGLRIHDISHVQILPLHHEVAITLERIPNVA